MAYLACWLLLSQGQHGTEKRSRHFPRRSVLLYINIKETTSMLRLMGALGAYILASALVPSIAAHAATYYVATTGSDSNPGTEEKPWRTVAYATLKLTAGDTIYVKNGTYTEGMIYIKQSGTASAPAKLLAYPGHAPVISFSDCGVACPAEQRKNLRIIIQVYPGHNKEVAWITVEGLTLQNGVNGIRWYNCRNCTIRRNWIRNTYGSGILGTGGVDNVIDRNIIEGAGDPVTGAHGLYLNGSRYVITNNLIYGTEKYHIQLNGTADPNDTVNYAGPEFAKTENVTVANNVLAYSRLAAGVVIWGKWVNNARIENNIFYQNGQDAGTIQGINWVSCCSTGVQIRNNIFYGTAPRPTIWISSTATEGVNYTQSGNLIHTSNPMFMNGPATLPASPNFRLTERSPAIDQGLLPERSPGLPLATTRIDFNGTTRPQGRTYDIGAYEYSTGNDTQSPAAPILQAP